MFNVSIHTLDRAQTRAEEGQRASIEAPLWELDIHDSEAAPTQFLKLDADAMDQHSERVVCSAHVRFSGGRTAVVHFGIRVDGEKVIGKITAGRRHGETIKTVNVPVWKRTHLAGK